MPALRRGFGRTALAVVVTVLVVAVPVGAAMADTVEDKQREAANLAQRIEQLEDKAELLAEEYNAAVEALANADEEVAGAKARLTEQEGQLATLRGRMSEFAVRSYVFADQSASVAALLDDTALSGEAAGRASYTALAMGANVDLTDQLTATLEDTQRQRAELEAKQERQRQLTDAVAGKRTAVDRAAADAQSTLTQVKGELVELVAAEQRRRAEEAVQRQRDEIRRQQADADAAARAASTGTASRRAGAGGGGAAAAPPPVRAPAPARPVPPPSPGAAGAVAAAMSQVGVGYRYASAIPGVAFDCSGLSSWAWGRAGVSLPRNSAAQYAALPKVPLEQLQPGDLVFKGSPIHHVGIYIGGGMQVHASDPSRGVLVSPIRSIIGAVRPG